MEPSATFLSPDARFCLEIYAIPMLMSHEVDSPYLFEVKDRKCLFDPGSLWEASNVEWSEDSLSLTMEMRQYPHGSRSLKLSFDLGNDLAVLTFEERTIVSGSLASVQKAMKAMGNVSKLLRS